MNLIIFMCMMIMMQSCFMVYGENREKTDSKNKKNECNGSEIEELYSERNNLCIDFEENKDRILKIDERLEFLGVKELSENEVLELLCGVKQEKDKPTTFIALNNSSTIKWTITREIYVCRGKEYELQIVRGVPKVGNSELISSELKYFAKADGVKAGNINAVKVIVTNIAGSLPVIGNGISTATTLYDVYKGYVSALSTGSTIKNVSASYLTTMTAEYIYVFVKYAGAIDTGKQILGYSGNFVRYQCSATFSSTIVINGTYYPKNISKDFNGTIASPYYNGNYRGMAAEYFWNYKAGSDMSKYNDRYDILSFRQQMLNQTIRYSVPSPNSGY